MMRQPVQVALFVWLCPGGWRGGGDFSV